MKAIYHPHDDILELHLSEKPVVRETSQDWNLNLSFAEDGSLVEIVILDAIASGLMPFKTDDAGSRRAA